MPNALMIHPGECNRAERLAHRSGKPVPHRVRTASAMGLSGSVLTHQSGREDERFIRLQTPDGDIAVVMIDGPIWYDHQGYSCWWGGTDTITLANTLMDIAGDDTITGCVLDIDSPGGSVAGINDLITAVDALAARKPTLAFGHEMMCSLAYWLASRCQAVYATPSSVSGSIGAMSIQYDTTAAAAKYGEQAHVYTSDAPLKGAGWWGVPITEEMDEAEQSTINAMGQMFRDAVAQKRAITEEQIRAMGGAAYFGQEQVSQGLVDELVPTTEFYRRVLSGEALTGIAQAPSSSTPSSTASTPAAADHGAHNQRTAMNDELKETLAALSDEDKEEARTILYGDEDDNTETATESEDDENQPSASDDGNTETDDENQPSARNRSAKPTMSITQAKSLLKTHGVDDPNTINALACQAMENNWDKTDLLGAAIKAMRHVDPAIEQEAQGSSTAIGGGRGAGGGGDSSSGGATAKFNAAVKDAMETHGISKQKAVAKVSREQPKLNAAYVAEYNAQRAG